MTKQQKELLERYMRESPKLKLCFEHSQVEIARLREKVLIEPCQPMPPKSYA